MIEAILYAAAFGIGFYLCYVLYVKPLLVRTRSHKESADYWKAQYLNVSEDFQRLHRNHENLRAQTRIRQPRRARRP